MPEFAKHILTFCVREKPHLQASFKIEDELTGHSPLLRIAELGRSGVRMQHCFNLIGVEYSTENREWPYVLRQTAVYNSFDLIGGQAFFLVLKANEVIRERIRKACSSIKRQDRINNMGIASVSFSQNLESHLLIFKWCVENWCSYLDFLQNEIRRASAHTRLSPIDKVVRDVVSRNTPPPRRLTGTSRKSSGLSFLSRASRSTSFKGVFGSSSNPRNDPDKIQSLGSTLADASGQNQTASTAEYQDLYKLFSFTELQELHHTSGKLEEARFVMSQDRNVMSDMMARFEKLHQSKVFTTHLPVDDIGFDKFFQGIQACVRELDDQQDRLRLMNGSLNKTMDLFNGILQYGNMRTGEFFAKQANASTVTMEQLTISMHNLATKTKKDTVSMHVITMITLFFLPGTFVAVRYGLPLLYRSLSSALTESQTFFSTGILNFDGDKPMNNLGDWIVRPAALKLFLAICLPLMGIVLLAWAAAYYWARRGSMIFPWTSTDDGEIETEKDLPAV
ncbi:hypothetical protein BKA67DRAFT_136972 [Truncatella angustata]|uniref:CorA-like transporter domain-containing protein n=1 Tax=Truncatella angustata TaxID=152316 RepID=A0A9P8REQ7_9PEZI|nr:uncharacterized protein BKA67DRAFT_136972 [Truncatella angustata]KAH6639929.1 hypothetical protein BKA67DRAFT_136972 [Truncatella angustata]